MAQLRRVLLVVALVHVAGAFAAFAQDNVQNLAVERALRTGSFDEAVALLEDLAKSNDAEAQYQLASLYRAGRGVARDDAKAFRWMRAAAATGLAKAQYSLGQMYLAGHGVPSNRPEAEGWLRQAAENGNQKASELLAKLAATPWLRHRPHPDGRQTSPLKSPSKRPRRPRSRRN